MKDTHVHVLCASKQCQQSKYYHKWCCSITSTDHVSMHSHHFLHVLLTIPLISVCTGQCCWFSFNHTARSRERETEHCWGKCTLSYGALFLNFSSISHCTNRLPAAVHNMCACVAPLRTSEDILINRTCKYHSLGLHTHVHLTIYTNFTIYMLYILIMSVHV